MLYFMTSYEVFSETVQAYSNTVNYVRRGTLNYNSVGSSFSHSITLSQLLKFTMSRGMIFLFVQICGFLSFLECYSVTS